ncbi:hypothetical protein C6W23_06060 [Bacillus atrophaeus]|nr:hypothetical protein C6W23_06060 [Bacillus atrophaeus]
MKKAFAAGIVLAGIEGIIGFILRDSMSYQSIFGTGAIIFITISIITSGAVPTIICYLFFPHITTGEQGSLLYSGFFFLSQHRIPKPINNSR